MKNSKFSHVIVISIILISLFGLTGCLERTEEIVVDSDGNTTINVKLNGKISDFQKSASYPTEELWEITENKTFVDNKGVEKQKLEAKQVIPYGTSFEETYTKGNNSELSLNFPTKVEKWKDGNKMFYKFSRTYKARTFIHYNFGAVLDENKELEEKVLEQGIFNVSEPDREQYLQNLQLQLLYFNYTIYDDALGQMVYNHDAPIKVKLETSRMMQEYLEKFITTEKLLKILKLEEDEIEVEYEKMNRAIESEVVKYVSKITSTDQSKSDAPFQIALGKVRKSYEITEALGSDKFSIAIQLPGDIIQTNGFIEPDSPGQVYWEIKGDALHDSDVPIFAVSVVED